MVIWLRTRNRELSGAGDNADIGAQCGIGVESVDDIVRREAFATIVDLDEAAGEIERLRQTILAEAHAAAEALIAQAKADAESLRDKARREYETAAARGYETGREQALSEWYERSAGTVADQRRIQGMLRERIVEVIVDATEQIVRSEDVAALFARSAEVVERIVEGSTYLRVRVHPDDHESASREFARLAADWRERGHGISVTVVGDRQVEPSSCLCESDLGMVDASLDTQLAALRAAVARAARQTIVAHEEDMDMAAETDANSGKVECDDEYDDVDDFGSPWLGEPGDFDGIAPAERHETGQS